MSNHDDDEKCSSAGSVLEHPGNECSTNNNVSWTRDQLEGLYLMSFQNYTIQEMCNEFGRTRRHIIRALRRIQAQQCMFHPIEDVACAHNMTTERLAKRMRDPLYYVPIKTTAVPSLLVAAVAIFAAVSLYGYTCFTP